MGYGKKKKTTNTSYDGFYQDTIYNSYYFRAKIKPLIMCSIYILNSLNIPPYLRRNALHEMYGKNVQYREEIFKFIDANYQRNYGFITHFTQIIKTSLSYSSKEKFIRNQIRMLINLKYISQKGVNTVYAISNAIGLTDSSYSRILQNFNLNYSFYGYKEQHYDWGYQEMGSSGQNEYYQILGLDKNATIDDAKNAYIKLVSKYHPDRYINKSPAERKVAEEKMKKINVAYEEVKKDISSKKYRSSWH